MIYAIEAVGLNRVKIGRASDPLDRLRTLKTGSPVPLRLLAAVPWGDTLETLIHRAFCGARLCGEWFEINNPIAELLNIMMCPNARDEEQRLEVAMEHLSEQPKTPPSGEPGEGPKKFDKTAYMRRYMRRRRADAKAKKEAAAAAGQGAQP